MPASEALHSFRQSIDKEILYAEEWLKASPLCPREMSLVRTKLQEAKMWAGKCLETIESELPEEFRDKAEATGTGQAEGEVAVRHE